MSNENQLIYKEFMKLLTVFDLKNTLMEHENAESVALMSLMSLMSFDGNVDGVSYNYTTKLALFNTAVLKVDRSTRDYYFTEKIRHCADVMDQISITSTNDKIKVTVLVNGEEYPFDKLKEFILISMPYTDAQLKFAFPEKPSFFDEIEIRYRHIVLSEKNRRLLSTSKIVTDSSEYTGGKLKVKP